MRNRALAALKIILLLLTCLFTTACETLNIQAIGKEQKFTLADDEKRLWKRSDEFAEIVNNSGFVSSDVELQVYLTGLVNNILPSEVKAAGSNVKVYVLNDPSFNAFMLPTGVMYIHTGLLVGLENEAQLVTVLGHELDHFISRHSLKFYRNLKNTSAFYATLSATAIAAPYASLAGLLVQYSFLSSVTGYSKEMEAEADRMGFDAIIKNNYDMQQGVRAFEVMEKQVKEEKIKEPYFFSTHPKIKERIRNFKELSASFKDKTTYLGKETKEDLYNAKIKGIILENAFLDIKKVHFKSAERAIERFLKLEPEGPEGYYMQGELFRYRGEKGDTDKALESYRRSVEKDNNYALAHKAMGLIYYKMKKSDLAKKEFQDYLLLSPQAQDKEYIVKYLDELNS